MKNAAYQKRYEDALAFAKDVMKQHGYLLTIWIAWRGEESHTFIVPLFDDEQKALVLSLLNIIFVTGQYDQYINLTEGWMVSTDPNKIKSNVRPSQDPGKKEVVVITSVTKEEKKVKFFEILRNKKEQVTDLVGLDPETEIKGRMTELLNPLPKDIPEEMFFMAKALFHHFSLNPTTFPPSEYH